MTTYPCPICGKQRKYCGSRGYSVDGYYATCGEYECSSKEQALKRKATTSIHGSPKRPKLRHFASVPLMHKNSLKCWRCGKPKSVGKAICDDCGKLTLGRRIAQHRHEDHWTFATGVKESKKKQFEDDVRKFDEMMAAMKK